MRVAIVTKSFAQSVNDFALPALIETVRALAKHVEIDVFALNYPAAQTCRNFHGLRIFSFGTSLRPIYREVGNFQAARRLMHEHSKKPYDVIHAIWADTPAHLASRLAKRLKLPLAISFFAGEATWIEEIGYGHMRNGHIPRRLIDVINSADVTTCGSEFLQLQIHKTLGVKPEVIPLGTNTQLFNPNGPSAPLAGEISLISSGSLTPVKGFDRLAEVFGMISEAAPRLAPKIHWHLIGPDAFNRDQRNLLANKSPRIDFTIHEALPFWELPNFYRAADLCVLSSHFESQCVAIQEAAACGTPVFGNGVGVLPSMASNDWHVAPRQNQQFCNLALEILSAPECWKNESKKQRDWVMANADVEESALAFTEIYKKLKR